MTDLWSKAEDARCAAAADWVVRLQSADLSEAQALAFDAWLAANPLNAKAYDAVVEVTLEIEARAPAIAAELSRGAVRHPTVLRQAPGRWLALGAAAVAAALVASIMPIGPGKLLSQTYVTGKGEQRTVKLADGSVIELNASSRLSVALGPQGRRVALPEGEAVFDVAADKSRPFLIAVGDRTVRVVGTRFDVRKRAGDLSVTVERGVVEVRPNQGAPGRAFRLHPGQRLDHTEGAMATEVSAADPAQVSSWRTGRLIYRDQPLGDVVADLNAQFPIAMRLEDPGLAEVRVSGVLILDNQAAVIRRLALLAPITALPLGGELLLRRDPAAKP